jgi:type IV secretion system protein VirB3
MTASSEDLQFSNDADSVFLGLTRPAMFWGVTHSFFVINLIVCLIGFLGAHSSIALLVSIPVHGLGYVACLRDPRIFDLLYTKASQCGRCVNRRFWGAISYDPA